MISTHRAILNALLAFGCRAAVNQAMRPPAEPQPWPPCFILIVPLFHVTGLVPVLMSCVAGGYKLVMMYRWDPERALESKELGRLVQVALDQLHPRYGDALEWKYIHGFSVKEIASFMDITPKAAESILSRAREAFRDAFAALSGGWKTGLAPAGRKP